MGDGVMVTAKEKLRISNRAPMIKRAKVAKEKYNGDSEICAEEARDYLYCTLWCLTLQKLTQIILWVIMLPVIITTKNKL